MTLLLTAFIVLGAWLSSSLWALWRNYQAARASGLPYIVVPVHPDNILYILVKVQLRPYFERYLPRSWYDRIKLTIMSWEFRDKFDTHLRVGKAFLLVTTSKPELWCADAAIANAILARRKDFVQLDMTKKIISFLGHNVLTSDGDSWARQRRIIAPNLNERIMKGIWDESIEQTNEMAEYLLAQPNRETDQVDDCLRGIAINVLGQVAYGEHKPFQPLKLPRDPDAPMTYTEAISLCTELLVVAALVPKFILSRPFMPKVIRTVGAALDRIPGLLHEMLEEERRRAKSNPDAGKTIMSQMVRLSDQGRSQDSGKPISANSQYLTDDEISGNLFVFTAAGFDTTANTMVYAMAFLSCRPQWQEWLVEEIDYVLGKPKQGEVLDYETLFPKLTRCLAFMYEVLRLFPPLLHTSRGTVADQTISIDGNTYRVPAFSNVYVNNVGLGMNPAVWGPDYKDFRPSRWFNADQKPGQAEIVSPPKGNFLPWSGGPRVCPGQKMAQVEFVTVFSVLFRKCRLELVPKEGETLEQAQARVRDLMQDSQTRLTMQMNNPKDLKIRWRRR